MKKNIILLFLTVFAFVLNAQHRNSSELIPLIRKDVNPVICYSRPEAMNTKVPLPTYIKERLENKSAKFAATSTFEVTYVGFTPEAQAAFQYAVDIWASILASDIPIKIYVEYKRLDLGVLASTGWGSLHANFKNVQKNNVWYVAAMAEKIAGEEINDPSTSEIVMSFGNSINWYQGTDQNPAADEYDMVSVVLHEIGHGLGYFSHTFVNDDNEGSYSIGSSEFPIIFDQLIENSSKENIIATYQNNTTELGSQLTSNKIFFRSFSFADPNLPKLYAPTEWNSGSSIAHLDEFAYPAGNVNSLMSPQLGKDESIHDPGLSLDMLNDMGWIAMKIIHNRLTDTEDVSAPYTITAVVQGDNPVLSPNDVVLHYSYNEWGSESTAIMAATANPDEYSADIPSLGAETKINYFISVVDSQNKSYTSPGEAPEYSHGFVAAKDTIPPTIEHAPLPVVFTHNLNAQIIAKVTDNIGTGDLILNYKVNGGSVSSFVVPVESVSTDGSYLANYSYGWDLTPLGLVKGDILEYRLEASDVAASPNSTSNPGVGFNIVAIDALNALSVQYFNDFNATSNDFVGSGFTISSAPGFSSDAIQSDHPYRVENGVDHTDTLILSYLLKTPILLKSKGATLEFDEVVLVEPGESGTKYGDSQFWDYVIVEGSTDSGITWKSFSDGYDSREDAEWEATYNSDIVQNPPGQDSKAVGDESLFRHKIIDLLKNGNFIAGDTVLVRFKIYADQLAAGWGWLIDNVKIQIDDTPPVITHIAPDYLNIGNTQVILNAKVTDNVEVGLVKFIVAVDGVITEQVFTGLGEDYELIVNFSNPVTATTTFSYSIYAEDIDANKNSSALPVSGKFEVPIAIMGESKTVYLNDFNAASNDFYGSNFTIRQESGFDDAAIHSAHPYSDAVLSADTFSYLLKYPIILNDGFAWVQYDEVVLIEPLSDRIALQASKDEGTTWIDVSDAYNSSRNKDWVTLYKSNMSGLNSAAVGDKSYLKSHLVDILSNSEFQPNDKVWIRFSMRVDIERNGWGWMIDNLEIQGLTTGIEPKLFTQISVYPNPAVNELKVNAQTLSPSNKVLISIKDQLGRNIIYQEILPRANKFINQSIDVSSLQSGIYIIQLTDGQRSNSLKFVKR